MLKAMPLCSLDLAGHCSNGLISGIYTLISQLVDHLPGELESSKDFADSRFECLEGSMDSLPAAIHFLDDIRDNSHEPIFALSIA
jgi:hypothetical protein